LFGYIDYRLRKIFRSQRPFGGTPVIVFGDLRRIGDCWIFQSNFSDPNNELYTTLWDSFKFFELTETMRQRDDHSFAIALNNMPSGRTTSDDIDLVSVVIEVNVPLEEIHFFCTIAATNSFSTLKLNRIATSRFHMLKI